MRPLVLFDLARCRFGFTIGKAICGNRRGIHENHGTTVRLRLVLRELEKVQGALDIDLMRRRRREF